MQKLTPRSWPIRWRLTALNVAVLAATLLALGSVFLLQLDNALISLNADYMRDQARPWTQVPRGTRGSNEERPPREEPFSLSSSRLAGVIVRSQSGPDSGALLFDPGGALVASSEPNEGLEAWPGPLPETVQTALAGGEGRQVVQQQTRRTLVLTLPIRSPEGGLLGAMQLSRSLELTDQLQGRLRAALALGTALSLLAAAAISLRATRAALRPLDRVVQAARRIGHGRLDERLRLARRDEIGELAEAFDHMLDRLAAVLAAQRRFVADAAHELKTPLTALGGMVEMLQLGADRGDPATNRRMLATMEREIDRLGRLVADLLTLSSLDADHRLRSAPVALGPLVAEVVSQTRLLANGQQVEGDIGANPTLEGDPDRLKQVLLNLAANAIAFTPPDGRIRFTLTTTPGEARITVADSGSGIPPEVLPRVMDRFVRGDPSRARSTGGFGLGLSIARQIVEAHGGSLELESVIGRGTVASVTLPLRPRKPSSSPPSASTKGASSGNVQLSAAEASDQEPILEAEPGHRPAPV
jgi:two-component system OmpR family sensor kinase